MKKPSTSKQPAADPDDIPEQGAEFFRRGIVRDCFQPISCGPDAPEKFKTMVAKAQGRMGGAILRNKRKAA